MNELKTRGVGDILIAVIDGLKGFPEAITAVFPETTVQTCILGPTSAETSRSEIPKISAASSWLNIPVRVRP